MLAGAGNQFFVHQQAIMLAIAKKTVAGCAPETILKAEICAMVCDDIDVSQAAVYDDQVFDSAWLAAGAEADAPRLSSEKTLSKSRPPPPPPLPPAAAAIRWCRRMCPANGANAPKVVCVFAPAAGG